MKPIVRFHVDQREGPDQRIVEIWDDRTKKSCRINICSIGRGLQIQVYACSPGVVASAEEGHLVDPTRDDLVTALQAMLCEVDAALKGGVLDALHPIAVQAANAAEVLSVLDQRA